MAFINELDKNTIDQIAAGEVVERPASVVKELVENAIDSGATAVTVEIKGGGIDMIRVTDNGSGIEKSQIRKAFKRHATSKLKSIEDLFSIHSLGFRGEALSSIASVAQVDLITKTRDELVGTRYCINGGEEAAFEEIGAPDGTTLIIRNLFYNTPARKKFLKTPQTEGSYIGDVMENCEKQRRLLGLPAYVFPAAMVVFGYPTEQQKTRKKPKRAAMKHIVSENKYPGQSSEDREDMFFKSREITENKSYPEWMRAFCERKYNSGFSQEMTRSVREYLKDFSSKQERIPSDAGTKGKV